jgi:LysR family transcriptional regulator, hydrogen peroxide-inducible genes activator
MTLTELRYVVALARERHFGHAADKCAVSQPTLSVAIKKLEEELGVILFERASNEIRVTEIGAAVAAQAERVLSEVSRVNEIASSGKDPLVGALRLGCIYTIAPYLLPKLVPLLKGRAPAMPLIIEESFTSRLIDKIKSGELDIGIMALPVDEPGLVAQAVYDEVFRLLCPVDSPLGKQKAITASVLLETQLLMLGPGNCFRDQVLDLCSPASRQLGSSPHILEGSSLETIRHMVASGVGVTVMPASAVDDISPKDKLLRVRPFVDPQPTRCVALVWRATYPRYRAIDVMRKALLDCRLPGTKAVKPGKDG